MSSIQPNDSKGPFATFNHERSSILNRLDQFLPALATANKGMKNENCDNHLLFSPTTYMGTLNLFVWRIFEN